MKKLLVLTALLVAGFVAANLFEVRLTTASRLEAIDMMGQAMVEKFETHSLTLEFKGR